MARLSYRIRTTAINFDIPEAVGLILILADCWRTTCLHLKQFQNKGVRNKDNYASTRLRH